MITAWNTSRVTTSKTTDRRAERTDSTRCSHRCEPEPFGTRVMRSARSVSRWMRLATPVAATTSTESSPSVSQARMSTSVMLTTL